jgi:hypothetical protein
VGLSRVPTLLTEPHDVVLSHARSTADRDHWRKKFPAQTTRCHVCSKKNGLRRWCH